MHSSFRDLPSGRSLLNFDVLRLVCGYLSEIPDVLSFALICSALTEDALRRRLSMSPVNLLNHNSIDRFYVFIFTNKDARAPHIYGLRLPPTNIYYTRVVDQTQPEHIDDCLVALLRAAVHIQYLSIRTFNRSSVFNATMELTTLREIHVSIRDVDRQPLYIHLTPLRSPLRSLCIDESNRYGARNISAVSLLCNHLGQFAPTLEVLDMGYIMLDVHPSFITTQFTAVRSFKADLHFKIPEADGLGSLLRLFPNLNTLVLDRFKLGVIGEEGFYPTWRSQNEDAQRAHSWAGLDRFDCNAEMAFIMALRCPIRRMDIEAKDPKTKHYLTTALRESSIRHLHLSLGRGLGILNGLLPLELADRLTHLSIFAEFEVTHKWKAHARRKQIPWDRFFDRVVDSVKHLRITYLRVVLHCTARQIAPRSFDGPFVNAAREVDLQSVAHRFMDVMPTLTHLFLSTCGCAYVIEWKDARPHDCQRPFTWVASKAWQAVRNPNEELSPLDTLSGSYIELSSDAARKIIDREDLHLSRGEEDEIQWCKEWMDVVDPQWSMMPREMAPRRSNFPLYWYRMSYRVWFDDHHPQTVLLPHTPWCY